MNTTPFVTIKLKQDTAEDFRRFSKNLRKQQSETLQLMLDFFQNHNLSPAEDLGPNMKTLEANLGKRINSLIAIIRDIEKTQTQPVLAMLQLLFQEETSKKKEPLLEKELKSSKEDPQNVATGQVKQLESNNLELQTDIKLVLQKVVVVRNSFGRPYLRLNLSQEEFIKLKIKYS